MDLYGYIWMYMDIYMDVYGYIWIYMDIYGYIYIIDIKFLAWPLLNQLF